MQWSVGDLSESRGGARDEGTVHHKAERRSATTKTVRETEAEAIAFIVGKAVGLETGSASADYISLYHGNASLLTESLEVIQQASAVILSALEAPTEEGAPKQEELAEVA
jgi:hypothetical protein